MESHVCERRGRHRCLPLGLNGGRRHVWSNNRQASFIFREERPRVTADLFGGGARTSSPSEKACPPAAPRTREQRLAKSSEEPHGRVALVTSADHNRRRRCRPTSARAAAAASPSRRKPWINTPRGSRRIA